MNKFHSPAKRMPALICLMHSIAAWCRLQVLDLYSPQTQASGGESPPLKDGAAPPKNDKKPPSVTPPDSASPVAGSKPAAPVKNGADVKAPPAKLEPIRYSYPPYPAMPFPVPYAQPPPTSLPPPPPLGYPEPPPARYPPVNVPPPNYFPPLHARGPPQRPYYPPPP